jgi:hypothetical protein
MVAIALLVMHGALISQERRQLPAENRAPLFAADSGEPDFLERRSEESEEEGIEIETDRDSFTPAVSTAPAGRVIFESAYSFLDNRAVPETHSFPEMVFRYGLTDRFEARIHWNYEVGGGSSQVAGAEGEADFEDIRIIRESEVSYGGKVRLTEQVRWFPESSLIVIGNTPTSGPDTATSLVATYVAGWWLPNRWKADAAMRYSADSEEGDGFNV